MVGKSMLMTAVVALGLLSARGGEAAAADARPRVAVEDFARMREDFTWQGAKGRAADWSGAFESRLRKVLADGGRLAPAEGGETAARFRLTGIVGFGFGEQPTVSISYEVAEHAAGRRRVVWADVVRIEAEAFAVTNLEGFVQATADAAATTVAERMTVNVLPHRVLSCDAAGLAVGGGVGDLRVGECLTVFSADREEVLGTVQIVKVDGASARAVVVESDVPRIHPGASLRRVQLISPWTGGLEKGRIRNDF